MTPDDASEAPPRCAHRRPRTGWSRSRGHVGRCDAAGGARASSRGRPRLDPWFMSARTSRRRGDFTSVVVTERSVVATPTSRVPPHLDPIPVRIEAMKLHLPDEISLHGSANGTRRLHRVKSARTAAALSLGSRCGTTPERRALHRGELSDGEQEAAIVLQEQLGRIGEVAAKPEVRLVESTRRADVASVDVQV